MKIRFDLASIDEVHLISMWGAFYLLAPQQNRLFAELYRWTSMELLRRKTGEGESEKEIELPLEDLSPADLSEALKFFGYIGQTAEDRTPAVEFCEAIFVAAWEEKESREVICAAIQN